MGITTATITVSPVILILILILTLTLVLILITTMITITRIIVEKKKTIMTTILTPLKGMKKKFPITNRC